MAQKRVKCIKVGGVYTLLKRLVVYNVLDETMTKYKVRVNNGYADYIKWYVKTRFVVIEPSVKHDIVPYCNVGKEGLMNNKLTKDIVVTASEIGKLFNGCSRAQKLSIINSQDDITKLYMIRTLCHY